MSKKASSVEEYIELASEDRQETLRQIRAMVLKEIPAVDETMHYKMPTYSVADEILFAFASQKNYLSFYICHYDLLAAQEMITSKYDCGKSCIRIKYFNKQALKDLRKLMIYAYRNIESSIYYGKYTASNKK